MDIPIGTAVQVWDDDRGCWRLGEVTGSAPDGLEVTIADGDHPRHPWLASPFIVPADPEFLHVLPCPTSIDITS
jgi:hypothetical protein